MCGSSLLYYHRVIVGKAWTIVPMPDEVQQLGETFNEALEALFFDDHQALAQCIRRYGIF